MLTVLNDVEKVLKVTEEFLTLNEPTFAKLCLALDCSKTTLDKYLKEEGEIGDCLKRCYLHIVAKHEERLYKNACTGSIFFLKCIRNLGFHFNDGGTDLQDTDKSSKKDITLRVITVPDRSDEPVKDNES